MCLNGLFNLLFTSSLQLLLSQQMESKENFPMEAIKHHNKVKQHNMIC